MLTRRFLLATLALLPTGALAHLQHAATPVTPEENDWLERQRAVDGTKCCNDRDIYVGQDVEWRIVRDGHNIHYEVMIAGIWRRILPGRILRPDPSDPSPFGSQALLFWMPSPHTLEGYRIFCFRPDSLG